MASNGTCPPAINTLTNTNGIFAGDDPLISSIIFIVTLSRLLAWLLKPLRQPRVVAEVVAGILLGPSAFARIGGFKKHIFPTNSLPILTTIANIGLIYFMFLLGLELDGKGLLKSGVRAATIAAASIALPFVLSIPASYAVYHILGSVSASFGKFLLFQGTALSVTAFPVLARILAERKLLTVPLGQLAMAVAALGDVVAWCLLAVTIALLKSTSSPIIVLYTLLSGIGACAFCFLVLSPFYHRVAAHSRTQDEASQLLVTFTLMLVLAGGFFTDFIGIHAIFGGFLVGLVIPHDSLFAVNLTKKIEDFVSIILLPLYFASSGLKTDVTQLNSGTAVGILVLIVAVACVGKILGGALSARAFGVSWRESWTLGILVNTKGLVELIVLNIGLNIGVIDVQLFTIMVLMALMTTFMTTPIVMAVYKPARDATKAKRLGVPASAPALVGGDDAQLRMLVCLYNLNTVPGMSSIAELSRGRSKVALKVHSLRLVELSDRPSAIMQMQGRLREMFLRKDPVSSAFQSYAQFHKLNFRSVVAVSPVKDMHEDILSLATAKHSNVIILPYPFGRRIDGVIDTFRLDLHLVTLQVLQSAPCSLGILVDNGFSELPYEDSRSVLVLFFGGADDREALCLASRMGQHPRASVVCVRFVLARQRTTNASGKDFSTVRLRGHSRHNSQDVTVEADPLREDTERIKDDAVLASIAADAERDIVHAQKPRVQLQTVNISLAEDPASAVLRTVRSATSHLVMCGRSQNPALIPSSASELRVRSFTARTMNIDSKMELGVVGSLLVAEDSGVTASVLVVKQPEDLGTSNIEDVCLRQSAEDAQRSLPHPSTGLAGADVKPPQLLLRTPELGSIRPASFEVEDQSPDHNAPPTFQLDGEVVRVPVKHNPPHPLPSPQQ
eukprot:jgi/Chlat1/2921/Chrsp2S00361